MTKTIDRGNSGGESRGQDRASDVRGRTFEVSLDDLGGFNFNKLQAFNKLSIEEIGNVTFIEADAEGAGGNYETDPDLTTAIGTLLAEFGVSGTLDLLNVNGSTADTFRAIWDYLDDAYVAFGPNDPGINELFVNLGVEYVDYLADGGTPLTFDTVKFSEGSRDQNMHDNILGNINSGSLDARGLLVDYGSLIPQEYLDRAIYSGNASAEGGPAHDAVRAFDYDKGWDREDYIETFLGTVDDRATDAGEGIEMIFGDGNSTDSYAITRHEGAGVELAIKAKERGIGDLDPDDIIDNGDGTFTYNVATGDIDSRPDVVRSTWNIDWAATVTEAGDDSLDDIVFKLLLDIDSTAAEEFVDVSVTGTEYFNGPSGSAPWNGVDLQNSWNYGFFPGFDATEEGTYTAKLEAYDAGELIAVQTIYVEAMAIA